MQFELTKNDARIENANPTEWIKWFEEVKENGSFEIAVSSCTFKDETQPVFYVIDEESNKGISVFAAHHPNAKFTDSTPHGVRLANAIGRAIELEGNVSGEDLASALTDLENAVVRVEKTDKGILWTVSTVKPKKAKK